MPGADGAVPHENGDVEKHVNRGLKTVIFGFQSEPVVPREDIAGDEARKNVVRAKQTDCAGNEEL